MTPRNPKLDTYTTQFGLALTTLFERELTAPGYNNPHPPLPRCVLLHYAALECYMPSRPFPFCSHFHNTFQVLKNRWT